MNDAADIVTSAAASSSSSDTDPFPVTAAGDSVHKTHLNLKRKEFITHMLRSSDIIVYLHLSYLYFLDCSFFRFAVRSAIQFLFLTPKIINLSLPPQQRSPVVALFGSAVFCVLSHLWETNPSAGELTHGYLHGGLIIDFIGQGIEGPISKWRLVYVDTAILLLQLVMLSLVISKQELLPPPADMTDEEEALGSRQDLESEERGEARQPPLVPTDLLLSDTLHDIHADDSGEMLDAEMERRVFEVTSGEFEAARMDIVSVVRRQWADSNATRINTGASVGQGTGTISLDYAIEHRV